MYALLMILLALLCNYSDSPLCAATPSLSSSSGKESKEKEEASLSGVPAVDILLHKISDEDFDEAYRFIAESNLSLSDTEKNKLIERFNTQNLVINRDLSIVEDTTVHNIDRAAWGTKWHCF